MKRWRSNPFLPSSVCIAIVAATLGGCSTVPTPAEPDGRSRVAANDARRVQTLQQRVSDDRALLTENNLLKAQVDVLQQKLVEMTALARQALVLPPPTGTRSESAPSVPDAAAASALATTEAAPPMTPQMAARAVSVNHDGVVVRVFEPIARTDFVPGEAVAKALRDNAQKADSIEVRGYTDSDSPNKVDDLIAELRVEKALVWLVQNGIDGAKIKTRHYAARHFLTDNQTQEGRALNRRIEIQIRNGPHTAHQIVSRTDAGAEQ